MSITANIIADSISAEGIRITTMQLRYPRFIHAEFMTHRDFSRNASSSRAIPVKRMIEDLRRDPAMPVFWGSNKPGMQAGPELTGDDLLDAKHTWLIGMEEGIRTAEGLMEIGLHKQIANRILEPWAHINVLVTSTNWENFFALRRHEDAQPEIKVLADAMHYAMSESRPTLLHPGEWHMPYVARYEREATDNDYVLLRKLSAARCARVSYLTHDGKACTHQEDLELFSRLMGGEPLHASPAEHQASPDDYQTITKNGAKVTKRWRNKKLHGNFTGWIQFRKTFANERALDIRG